MFLFGINFNLYFFILLKRIRDVVLSEELRVYTLLCALSTLAIVVNTMHLFEKMSDCIRTAFFQVTTIMSTTGFSTVDYNVWPDFSKTLLVILMIVGACAGSTAGGLKISRVIILVKSAFSEIKKVVRPRSVNVVRLDGETLTDETVRKANVHLALYTLLILASVLAISIDGFGLETNLTAVLSCVNNIGPGLGLVGPAGNFAGYSYLSKIILSVNMLFGRLELMPMLILFSPTAWKKR